MATTDRADTFAHALQEFEQSADLDGLSRLFADDADLSRPEVTRSSGKDAAAFWESYRGQFSDIRSDFTHVDEDGRLAVLEWTSTGRLATGRDIEYDGVSLLTFGDDDLIVRFATYYDTAAFLEQP